MTFTSVIPLSIDGTRLDTLAYNIETIDGRMGLPSTNGSNPPVPGRHGSLYVANKTFNDASIVLKMWVNGSDINGQVPGGSSELAEFRKNIDALVTLFGRKTGLLDVRQTWPGGIRQAFCEVLAAVDFSGRAIQPTGRFSVSLDIPAVFWQDVSTSDYASATNLTTGTTLTMAVYDGASAPMEDHLLVVRGPATNPRLTDPNSGMWVQYNGTIASGTDWQIDVGNWTSKTGAALLFGAGGTSVVGTTVYGGGGPRYLPLTPKSGGPQLTLTGSGLGTNTQVQARGRRKYFT